MPCNIWTQIMNDTKDTKLIYSILYELLYTKQRQGLVSAVRSTGPLPASQLQLTVSTAKGAQSHVTQPAVQCTF